MLHNPEKSKTYSRNRKTEVLVRYGFNRCQSALSTSVFWVSASSCSSFRKSYEDIATKLKLLDPREDAPQDVLQLVKETLESKEFGEWVMIVDNADDLPNLFIDHHDCRKKLLGYLPEGSPNPILYSTRSKTVARQLAASGDIIWVQALSGPEAAGLLIAKLKSAGMPHTLGEGWSELLHDLEYLPLAIIQAASYMAENEWTVPTCLEYYRADKSAQMLKHEFQDINREVQFPSGEETDHGPTNAVAPMFTTILSQIKSQDPYAADLLCLMAAYSPKFMPREILQETQDRESNVRFAKSIGILTAFSLVSTVVAPMEGWSDSIRVHRLVQRSIRDWLVCHDQFKYWYRKGLAIISKRFQSQIDTDGDIQKAYHLHAHTAIDPGSVTDPGDERHALCELFMNISLFHGCMERLVICKMVAKSAHSYARLWMPEDLMIQAKTSLVLAKAFITHGEYDEAEDMCKAALEVYVEKFGNYGMLSQEGFHLLGSIYYARGQYEKAFKLLALVLDTGRRDFGMDDTYARGKVTSWALSLSAWLYNVALFYDYQSKDDFALREVLKWTIEHKGADSRATRIAMTNLASSLVRWNLEKAWELNEEVLRMKGEPLDPSDPPTRENLRIRALVLYGRNENTEAERWARVVLESSEKALGLKHPKTLEHAFLLALVLIAAKKHRDAEEFASRAYEGFTELYGLEDKWTKDCQIVLEVILAREHRWGYHWTRVGTGLWSRAMYSPEEFDEQNARVKVAEELPYKAHLSIKKRVDLSDEDLQTWRNYSLLKRLPCRVFSGYVSGTLEFESFVGICYLLSEDLPGFNATDDPANATDNPAVPLIT